MNHWKINFILLLAVSTLTTIAVLIVCTDILRDLKVKESQITKLIDEVGTLKSGSQPTARATTTETTQAITSTEKITIGQESKLIPGPEKEMQTFLIVGHHSKLTDTIMVAVVDHKTKKVTLLSIPRDFATNGRKINEYYEFFGIKKLAEEITKITSLQIDKYAIVDMKSFKQFVDSIGGVDITIEKDLIDYNYPTEKKGYQTFSLKKGTHRLNGDLALKFARSRKSTSDFDRAKRQQELLKAIRTTLESKNDIIGLLEDIYNSTKDNVETNISFIDAVFTWRSTQGYKISTNHVFTTSDLLYSTHNTAGQYILLPKAKNYSEIQQKVSEWLQE